MYDVIREAVIDALHREKWLVLQGNKPFGLEQPWTDVHAMLMSGVVCWWRVFPVPAGGNIIIQLIVEDHRITVEEHIELSDQITARMRSVPQAIRSEAKRVMENDFASLLYGNFDLDHLYKDVVRQMAIEYTPVLSPEFRRMLRQALDRARNAHRDGKHVVRNVRPW